MAEIHALLDLQRVDSMGDELRARRAGLPERAELQACTAEMQDVVRQRGESQARRETLSVEERRVDGLVANLASKVSEVEGTLYSGKVTAPKELEALQLELDIVRRHQSEHEEEELALMEQEERISGEIAQMDARHRELEARVASLGTTIESCEREIDGELESVDAERIDATTRVPPPLLTTYEKLRARGRPGGRAAVGLEGERCSGCRVTVPIADAGRVRDDTHPGAVLCAGCGCILVA